MFRPMLATAATALACAVPGAHAQSYPSKPIRFIAPFALGAGGEFVMRLIGQKVTESTGQQILIDSRPGAGGTIGIESAVKSPPDGYTMVLGTIGPMAIMVSLVSKIPYDPIKDLAPVSQVVNVRNMLVVHPSLPVKSVTELIELAKARPGQLNFGSSGPGAPDHLAGELFKTMTGVSMVHIPYKGGAPALLDLMAGNVQLAFATVQSTLPFIKSGKVRPIAMSGTTRFSLLPDIPTIAEAGVPGFAVNNWYGVLVPAGTPREIVTRLNAELVKALNNPDLVRRFNESGIEPAPSTPEQFTAYIESEIKKWAKVVKDAGAKLD